jgi:hypothetical protein
MWYSGNDNIRRAAKTYNVIIKIKMGDNKNKNGSTTKTIPPPPKKIRCHQINDEPYVKEYYKKKRRLPF